MGRGCRSSLSQRNHVRGAQDLEAGSEGIRGEAVPGSDAEGGAALWPWGAGRVRVAGVAWSCREGQRFAC